MDFGNFPFTQSLFSETPRLLLGLGMQFLVCYPLGFAKFCWFVQGPIGQVRIGMLSPGYRAQREHGFVSVLRHANLSLQRVWTPCFPEGSGLEIGESKHPHPRGRGPTIWPWFKTKGTILG